MIVWFFLSENVGDGIKYVKLVISQKIKSREWHDGNTCLNLAHVISKTHATFSKESLWNKQNVFGVVRLWNLKKETTSWLLVSFEGKFLRSKFFTEADRHFKFSKFKRRRFFNFKKHFFVKEKCI